MKKIAASSLVEVLVAGVLLCMVVSIGMVTFIQVTVSSPSLRKHQLALILEERMSFIRRQPLSAFERTDTVAGEGVIVETVTPFKNSEKLFVIDLKVLDVHGNVAVRTTELHYQFHE